MLDEIASVLFGRAADFADHNDALGFRVAEEHVQAVNEVGAVDRIAADADASRLTKTGRGGLSDRLVRQRTGTRYDADLAALMNVARHNADLALARRDHAGAIRADETSPGPFQGALTLTMSSTGMPSVMQTASSISASMAQNGVGGEQRQNIDNGSIGAGSIDGVPTVSKTVEMVDRPPG